MDGDSLAALWLLPLVEVAWADGQIHPGEQRRIALCAQRMGAGDEAMMFVRSWLRYRPTDAYCQRGRRALADLLAEGAPELAPLDADGLLAEAEAVANASGSWLPFLRVSASERAVLTRLQSSLADRSISEGETELYDPHPDLDRALNPVTLDFDTRHFAPDTYGGVLIPDFTRTGRYVIPPGGLVVGRADSSDLQVLDYPPIVDHHCRFNVRGDRYYIQEMAGETRVNGERVLERRLLGGETVRLAEGCSFAFKRVRRIAPVEPAPVG